MRAALHIHDRRPNDRAYRAPNWNKHSLGQWVELMGVGHPECARDGTGRATAKFECGARAAKQNSYLFSDKRNLSRIFVQPPTDTGSSILYFSKMGSVTFCPVQYRRPNGWADLAENWHKHSLELCDEDRKCALMRVQRAPTCEQHHISSIGGQTAGPI
jgi:hypothetical protein